MGVKDGEEKEEGGSSICNSAWVYVGLCGSTWAQLGGPTWAPETLSSIYLHTHTRARAHTHTRTLSSSTHRRCLLGALHSLTCRFLTKLINASCCSPVSLAPSLMFLCVHLVVTICMAIFVANVYSVCSV